MIPMVPKNALNFRKQKQKSKNKIAYFRVYFLIDMDREIGQ